MIKVVCDVCGAEEATSALSAEWRTIASAAAEWSGDADAHAPAQLCSVTCVARWAEAHGAAAPSTASKKTERRMSDDLKRAMKRQVDLRALEDANPAT